MEPFSFNLSPLTSIEQIRPEHTWALRRDILYPGMMKHEMEMVEDDEGMHFGAYTDNKLIGVISLFHTGTDYQFRKLAIAFEYQRKGIGNLLLDQVALQAEQEGGTRIWCNARIDAIGFYIKAGYHQTGKLFTKNDIDYEIMEKSITPASDRTE